MPYQAIVQEELYFGLESARDTLDAKDWRREISTTDEMDEMLSGEPPSLGDKFQYIRRYVGTFGVSRQSLFEGFQADYLKVLEVAGLSYAESKSVKMQISNRLSESVLPIFDNSRFGFEYDRCLNELLLLQLAIRAYKLEKGKYPGSLDMLVPEYIKSIPNDPFSTETTYQYLLASDGYRLYSIGPDLHDDGGKPIKSSAKPRVTAESKGDIVAGITGIDG